MYDPPPFWNNLSVWINPDRGCYDQADMGGTRIMTPSTVVGSITNHRRAGQYFNALSTTTHPVTYEIFQGESAIYSSSSVKGQNAGMESNVSFAHAEMFALIAAPGTSWAYYGSVLAGSGHTASNSYGLLFQQGDTDYYALSIPALSERNGVSTNNLAPINQWFLLRYRLKTGSHTSVMRLFIDQMDANRHCTPLYIGIALAYDITLSSSQADQVEQWFQRQYPSLTLT
jgi:hypothetical protein